ncbi:MAG: cation transporter [Bacteroidetes bacterium]|jgi:mercuric ion binding protein|nr:cation transporter [Bacteroidota bacterium]HQW47585.1 heavy-metal-associated domain-containing protein [Chitinophagaceae bacterium]
MKSYIFSIIMLMFSIISFEGAAQNNTIKTDTVTILGNCSQCKERIEDAAYVKGVKSAQWDKQTKILTVVYNTSKTDLEKIQTAIAKVGHDSKGHLSTDKDYKKLPDCCAYRTGVCHHE